MVRKLFRRRCFPFEVLPVSVPKESSVREMMEVIWKMKIIRLSEHQVYILPFTSPGNPQILLINEITLSVLNFLRPGR